MKVLIYFDVDLRWRWRIRARNGKIVACSGESFYGVAEARRAARGFIRSLLVANYKGTLGFADESTYE
jgi:uncharacterized protein YegP (UPF0339 family)